MVSGINSDHFKNSFAVRATPVLVPLLALTAFGGILLPSTYARETTTWAAQGVGQDWVNLLVVVPWMALSGFWAARGSRRALLLLGGGLVYLVYGFLAYTLAVHFNALFLLYCAVLGLSFFALASLGGILHGGAVPSWFAADRIPVRLAGVTQLVVGAMFALVWLSEVVPALLRGVPPPSVVEAGLLTNPVHVLDLSLLLPGLMLSGISLLRRRPLGLALSPLLLGFAALMVSAIGGMVLVMALRRVAIQWALAVVFAVVAVATFIVLAKLLTAIREVSK
jgi:hypothetical protein